MKLTYLCDAAVTLVHLYATAAANTAVSLVSLTKRTDRKEWTDRKECLSGCGWRVQHLSEAVTPHHCCCRCQCMPVCRTSVQDGFRRVLCRTSTIAVLSAASSPECTCCRTRKTQSRQETT